MAKGPPPPPPGAGGAPPAPKRAPPPARSEFVDAQAKPGPLLQPELQGIPLMGQMYRVRPGDSLASIAEQLRSQGVSAPVADIVRALFERNRLPGEVQPTEALLLARGALFIPRL